jgi:hypothetical protein
MPTNPLTTPRLTMLQRLSSLFRRRILVTKTRPESPDGEIGQQVHGSEFLKSPASPSQQLAPGVPPGLRRVALRSWRSTKTYEVTLDISRQVLRLEVPEEFEHRVLSEALQARLFPSFAEGHEDASRLGPVLDASKFAPAAALALKAKQFDDGLYASVELAADAGLGRFPSRKDFLLRLLQALVADSDRTAGSLLTAAARLGGQQPQVSAEVTQQAEALQQEFLGDESRSKVLGFYTWSEELSRIFRRDRMLQTEIKEPAARAFAAALSSSEELLTAYDSHLRLAEKLTNTLAWDDLREPAVAQKEGRISILPGRLSLFPPSRAHETDLVKKLFPDHPIPEGFDLADEMIRRLRAGDLDLAPAPASGWYDHQTYALEALAVPERMPEGKNLLFDESYRKELVGLFKALLALTRETHIKQLEVPLCAMADVGALDAEERLFISPGLTLEPLPTYYVRRACSYRFVHRVLDQAFGTEGLDQIHRLTADGPVTLSLGEELRLMQAIFYGAYQQACGEIGMTAEAESDLGNSNGTNGERAVLATWLASVRNDPDLGKDIRMMVPIFYDLGRKKTKVWVVLGIATKPLEVSYVTPPTIKEIKSPDGKILMPGGAEVVFTSDSHQTAYFATAEVYVTRLLDRTEFRKHCDKHKTYRAIISNLE